MKPIFSKKVQRLSWWAMLMGSWSLIVLTQSGCKSAGSSRPILYYPYQTVYGEVCATFDPIPGCTFHVNGGRISVHEDSHYNSYGRGSDDMWFVVFDSSGTRGNVFDENERYRYSIHVSEVPGYLGGSVVGVGTSGLFWENVAYGTYWLGANYVLYSANSYDSNFGRAINDSAAGQAVDTNLSALASEDNQRLVQAAADSLVSRFSFAQDKAMVVASTLNQWAVAGAERGYTTDKDMDISFKAIFGVDYLTAQAAVRDAHLYRDSTQLQDITNRSAASLGLKPYQAKEFMREMYSEALAEWGQEDFDWDVTEL